jgi:hypothetical protein
MGHEVIPLEQPRPAWGRSSFTYASRRPSRSLYIRPALPVRTAAVPRRSIGGEPAPERRAQLRHQRAASSWLAPCLVSAPFRRVPGTPATAASLRAATKSEAGPRRCGGGSHRRQPGCREQLWPRNRAVETIAPPCTRQTVVQRSSAGRRAVLPLDCRWAGLWCGQGRASRNPYRAKERVPSAPGSPATVGIDLRSLGLRLCAPASLHVALTPSNLAEQADEHEAKGHASGPVP